MTRLEGNPAPFATRGMGDVRCVRQYLFRPYEDEAAQPRPEGVEPHRGAAKSRPGPSEEPERPA